MRSVARFFAILLCLITTAAWGSSVLLPEDSGQAGPSQNAMGLNPPVPVPAPAPATAPEAPLPSATEALNLKNAPPEIAALIKKFKTTTTTTQTVFQPGGTVAKAPLTPEEKMMAGKLAAGKVPTAAPLSDFEKKIKAYQKEQEEKYARDPVFLTDIDIPKIENENLKNSLAVSLGKEYLWGPEEASFIKDRLGYEPSDIPRNCQLRLDVDVITKTNPHGFSDRLFTNARTTIQYDDTDIQTVSFRPHAVCYIPKTPLPRHGGIITRVGGDKYSVQLTGKGSCAPPPQKSVRYLDVAYGGDGAIVCQYR